MFKFTEVRLWTDSKVTLSWIASVKDIKDIYVSNRVQEIRQLVETFGIKLGYINTKLIQQIYYQGVVQ